MHPSVLKKAVLPTVLMALVMLCIQFFAPLNFWIDWYMQPETVGYYCEQQTMNLIFREPISSWSNIMYWYLGWLILLDNKTAPHSNFLYANPGYIWYWGALYLFMGAASWFFHASVSSIALGFDMGGVYISFLLPFILNVHRLSSYSKGNPALKSNYLLVGLILFAVVVGGTLGYWEDSFNAVPALLIGLFANTALFIYIEKKWTTHSNKRYLWIAIFLITFAAFSWCIDRFKVLCDPAGWIHGHALWHLLMSVAAFQLYLYYKSEGENREGKMTFKA